MRKMMKRVIAAIIVFSVMIGINAFSELLMPPRTNYGSTWKSYLEEERNTIDVLFFGSSLVYCDVIPATIWENSGLRSYVMAGPEQTMSITEYYVKESCKTQSPQAIVLELNGLFFPEYGGFTKANIGYMPWSINRLKATVNAAEKNLKLGLLFPVYEYHDRVFSIENVEFLQNLNPQKDMFAGYTVLYDCRPQEQVLERDYRNDTDVYKSHLESLKNISVFCDENNIKLVLYIAPSYSQIPSKLVKDLTKDLESVKHCAFWDCNDGTWPETNPETDWYDSLHYNLYGALSFSKEMSDRLKELDLEITQTNSAIWEMRLDELNLCLDKK